MENEFKDMLEILIVTEYLMSLFIIFFSGNDFLVS